MAWTTPLTAVANTALTAAQWNASVRDNLLETAVAKATAAGNYYVGTAATALAERTPGSGSTLASETTTSTSYVDLATAGASVTVTSGPNVFVAYSATMSNSTVNAQSLASMSISGATTSAASDTRALRHVSATANASFGATHAILYGVTSGSNTFLMKYRVTSNTGTFDDRRVTALPF